jgi:sugar (pentulose or hexulose) kinase
VIEGLNYQLKDMVKSIGMPMNLNINKIVATGGASRSKVGVRIFIEE